jgi:two-component system, chemotaxis family, CheB/CheR fusion protein
MPHSAIVQGGVDFILPPTGIAQELARVAQHLMSSPPSKREEASSATLFATSQERLGQLFRILRAATGVDFSFYKQSTVRRRILRRMRLRRVDSLAAYLHCVMQNREELDALYHDLFSKVTRFFRDPDTFEALKREVFPAIMRDRPANRPVRIWVPGCATGEECYSIAISLLEYLGDRVSEVPVQIFATDVDEIALAKARTGRYLQNVAHDISPECLRRFFTRVDERYQIIPTIRKSCTFGKHDLCSDPPIYNLDLISCQNSLIYFEPAIQERVIAFFDYALKPNGFLVLGMSESIGTFTNLFTPVGRGQKIFAKKVIAARPLLDFPLPAPQEHGAKAAAGSPHEDAPLLRGIDVYREADRVVLNQYAPAGVLINERMDILQFRGDTSHFLRLAPGKARLNLLQMAREGLPTDLRAAIAQAKQTGSMVTREGVRMWFEGHRLDVTIQVIPLALPSPLFYCVVLFVEVASPAGRGAQGRTWRPVATRREDTRQLNSQLAQELEVTKQYLHSIIERYEAVDAELQAANEEILLSNQELQSINEELETAKEELNRRTKS